MTPGGQHADAECTGNGAAYDARHARRRESTLPTPYRQQIKMTWRGHTSFLLLNHGGHHVCVFCRRGRRAEPPRFRARQRCGARARSQAGARSCAAPRHAPRLTPRIPARTQGMSGSALMGGASAAPALRSAAPRPVRAARNVAVKAAMTIPGEILVRERRHNCCLPARGARWRLGGGAGVGTTVKPLVARADAPPRRPRPPPRASRARPPHRTDAICVFPGCFMHPGARACLHRPRATLPSLRMLVLTAPYRSDHR
jgi:hypothetical protein